VNVISTRRERIAHPKERKLIKYFVLFFLLLILKPFSDMIIGSTLTILLIILVVLHFTYGIKKSFNTFSKVTHQLTRAHLNSFKRIAILLGVICIGIMVIVIIMVGNEVSDQSIQLNNLTKKIDLIEKKLGGDKKLKTNAS
jgi:mannose/fructose/N-acetylgalactosamine-specific phosphotransferase system component IID